VKKGVMEYLSDWGGASHVWGRKFFKKKEFQFWGGVNTKRAKIYKDPNQPKE